VHNECDDAEALSRLTTTADGNKKDLQTAATLLQLGGCVFELPSSNRAWRLLNASAGQTAIAPPTNSDQLHFVRMAEFAALDEAPAYEMLVGLEPRLEQFISNLRAEGTPLFSSIDRALKDVIGPSSGQQDFLLSSNYAFGVASSYLADAFGLFDDE
jgi:hypothetical protein